DDARASLPTNGFPWDAYHVNAINLPGDGTFVVSMRNTWAAYKVDIATGRILWTLGGRHSNFKLGPGAEFEWQHDVAVYPGSPLVTLFDDHCCQITGGGTYVSPTAPSRGLVLKLNPAARTTVYASWNGATRLASWRVLAGSDPAALKVVAGRPKSGFETAVPVTGGYTVFRVEALDAGGRVIGFSKDFRDA